MVRRLFSLGRRLTGGHDNVHGTISGMDSKTSSDWRFERDSGVTGFMSTQQVSTDALNALNQWQAKDVRRAFEVLAGYESDEFMEVRLSTGHTDANGGGELDALALKYGVMRRPL